MAVRIMAGTTLETDPNTGDLFYRTFYQFTEPVNGVENGAVDTPVTDVMTETTFNATFAAACADHANLGTGGGSTFTAADVIGGRI